MQKILVVGSSNIDLVIHTKKLPKPGETVIGNKFLKNPGGKGANQAVAAARLGGQVAFITKVGNDDFGKELTALYQKEGIDCQGVLMNNSSSTGVALINVDKQGENSITVASGANKHLSVEDIMNLSSLIDESDIILMQLEVPIETVEYIIDYAGNSGKKIILNPAPAHQISDKALPKLFAITPNETEIEYLTGIRVQSEESAAQGAATMIKKGVENVIITLGAKGAYFMNENEHLLIPAPKVKAIDTTAAGDIFNGAFVVALANGKSIKESVEYACLVSSLSVTRLGAQNSAPYQHEIENIIGKEHSK
ncbi:MAG TPA: ribokinase [Porphyromonadaceae bacterium]|jgi:ribokinase|uniref:ribokinase n=1 Tax=Limibacterium fermenti TaxID=3229863 RepID=UPI000E95A0FF|nr:ribokinase [Porphyromonadaceae bacterium]HBX20493.1 ribokinase [Porphyromonadaceae bacterium]HBX44350.1 ribokinase [Porphyromonadaceae bacterium]HCM20644.1 ribokinase [Porphyromonadaceae bacterium]